MNRRSALQAAAAAAVAAIPPGCIMSPAAAAIRKAAPYIPSDDAALVTLGRQFDEAHAAWMVRWKEWDRIEKEWLAALKAKRMSFAEHGTDAVCSIFTELGGDEASAANDVALEEVERIADQIRPMHATTLTGFAVRAKVACFDAVPMSQLMRPDEGRDWGHRSIIDLATAMDTAARAQA